MTNVLAALQLALEAENRAIFGYGVLGPRLTRAADVARARDFQTAHETLRDSTAEQLAARGQQPDAPLTDYPDIYPVSPAASPQRLARTLEDQAASAWRSLYAVAASITPPDEASRSARSVAQRALIDSAVRATQWRVAAGDAAPMQPFPGI